MSNDKFKCSHCDKKYKVLKNLEKHMLLCKYKNNNEYQYCLPSKQELYTIIVTMAKKIDKMEKEIETLNRITINKNKKVNVIDWLNENIKPLDFDKWKNSIEVLYKDFEEAINTTQIQTIVNIIRRHIDSIASSASYPIKCFDKHKDCIYIYKEPAWRKMDMEDIYKLRGLIEGKLREHIKTWEKNNEHRNETDEYSDEFINIIGKISGNFLSYQELGRKFKSKLFAELKCNFTRVTLEFNDD